MSTLLLLTLLAPIPISTPTPPPKRPTPEQLDAYWNQGQAEITSYHLEQARYGELHRGHAVQVFVTEPFSKSKQVKLDNPGAAGDHTPVLKLNFTRKFNTGIYPYSMMTSTFTPLDGSTTIKSTTSSQEWCGHTFLQLNLKPTSYDVRSFSYFESESDRRFDVKRAPLEDALWTQIRIAPNKLPLGDIELVPGATFLRLRHIPLRAQRASATLKRSSNTFTYTVKYKNLNRTLSIQFEAAAPHRINGWTETYTSGFGPGQKSLTTRATLNKRIKSAYWNKHTNADSKLRDTLGLPN